MSREQGPPLSFSVFESKHPPSVELTDSLSFLSEYLQKDMHLRSKITDKLSLGATGLVEFDPLPAEGNLFLIKHADYASPLDTLYNDVKATAHIALGHLTDLIDNPETSNSTKARIVLYPPDSTDQEILQYIDDPEKRHNRRRKEYQARRVANDIINNHWDEEIDEIASLLGLTRNERFVEASMRHLTALRDVIHSGDMQAALPELQTFAKLRPLRTEILAS